ncbi:unnamed protein product [Phytophthora fragariaefolia]|uniref:Unnamed protein product n=1 Tax=Phytophthora fragariaefolia TaxID=1490495 RepID=A0A9W7D2C9_9STRA|nr:unnamed protein product [Phytophthora fragariaefolia]
MVDYFFGLTEHSYAVAVLAHGRDFARVFSVFTDSNFTGSRERQTASVLKSEAANSWKVSALTAAEAQSMRQITGAVLVAAQPNLPTRRQAFIG